MSTEATPLTEEQIKRVGEVVDPKSVAQKVEPKVEPIVAEPPVLTDDEITLRGLSKKYGQDFKSFEDFESFSKPKVATQEEVAKEQEENKLKQIDYYVKNKNGKVDDLAEIEKIKAKNDKDLVFEAFSANLKAKKADITDEEVAAKFNKKFAIKTDEEDDSFDAVDMEDGQLLLKAEADKIRSSNELVKKWNETTGEYESFVKKDKEVKAWTKEIEKFVSSDMPKTISVKINETESVNYDLNEDMVKEVAAQLSAPKFLSSLVDKDGKTNLKALAELIVKAERFDDITAIAYKQGYNKAADSGTIGLKNPLHILPKENATTTEKIDYSKAGEPIATQKKR